MGAFSLLLALACGCLSPAWATASSPAPSEPAPRFHRHPFIRPVLHQALSAHLGLFLARRPEQALAELGSLASLEAAPGSFAADRRDAARVSLELLLWPPAPAAGQARGLDAELFSRARISESPRSTAEMWYFVTDSGPRPGPSDDPALSLAAGAPYVKAARALGESLEKMADSRPALRALLVELRTRFPLSALEKTSAMARELDERHWNSAHAGAMLASGFRFRAPPPRPSLRSSARLRLGKDGAWRPQSDRRRMAGPLREALGMIQEAGIDLGLQEAVVAPRSGKGPPPPLVRRQDSVLVLDGPGLKNLSAQAAAQGRDAKDALARALLADHLENGLWGPLKQSAREVSALGLGPEARPAAAAAIKAFLRGWTAKFDLLLERLKEGLAQTWPERLQQLEDAAPPPLAAVADPHLGLLALSRGEGRLDLRRLGPGGEIPERQDQELTSLPKELMGLALDPVGRWLIAAGRDPDSPEVRIELRRIAPDGSLEETPARVTLVGKDPVTALAGDSLARRLWVARQEGKVEAWTLLPDGGLEADPLVERHFGGIAQRALSLAVDTASETLFLGMDQGRLRIFEFDYFLHGGWSRPHDAFLPGAAPVAALAFDPLTHRLLVAEQGKGLRLATVPAHIWAAMNPENREALVLEPAAQDDGRTAVALDPASGSLIAARGAGLERFSFPAPKDWSLEIPGVARALAAGYLEAGEKRAVAIGQALRNALNAGLIHAAWDTLVAPALARKPPQIAEPLEAVAGSARWFRASNAAIKSRLPDLWNILHHPARVSRLLTALSLLRLVYPYDLANASTAAPLAWSEAHHAVFRLGRSRVAPVSESFRRHIVYDKNQSGLYAVELKIPGQDRGRETIFPEHYDVAEELWRRFPIEPGVVRPLHFSQYTGALRMYGRRLRYDGKADDDAMGLAVLAYQDGKRVRNILGLEGFWRRLEQKTGKSSDEIYGQALEDTAVAAIRLHLLGWLGSNESQTDMHPENLRILEDGRVLLVGDFGAFEQGKGSLEQRRQETLFLLGGEAFLSQPREFLEGLVNRVIDRLVRDFRAREDAARRAEITQRAVEELGFVLGR